ncbi:MAG TPA: acyl-CoA dehydrogenase family protein [Xanthobacteraceae bacterium]|nr:acyl-CoA dehydrogenase family protein [Xanthobacteraceae bacterium]
MSRPAAKPGGFALTDLAAKAAVSATALVADATLALRARIAPDGALLAPTLEREQRAAHGLAWLATYAEAVRQLAAYAGRMEEAGRLGDIERLLVTVGLGELLAQMFGGIAMSQGEIARLADLGLADERIAARRTPAVEALIAAGTSVEARAALAVRITESGGAATIGDAGDDRTLAAMRDEMRRFAEKEVAPYAQRWHLDNAYIPLETIARMAELGVFGLTVPEAYGGLGLGKESTCVVSEELSRGWIGVGSLGTRAEIAAELILAGGTDAQKKKWLPDIATGAILPTAVFTEPDTGSDLAALKTRAVRDGGVYRVYGNKTWITHAARADLMTLLVRTDTAKPGYQGLSMLIAEKPRGGDADPFPAPGMSGGEILVPGYRGMKEFEIAFDGFAVPAENLLGETEGEGFKQLMQTFESARIQTAARSIGVAQAAMDAALRYARERHQFGKAIFSFPRVADKIAMMAVEILVARQLTYHAAREKDSGRRCDLEAGMAKLYAARAAWAAADNAVQVHGGNGFALEYPVSRLLADARILSIFEGAAEIQAQVIARRLLDGSN